MVYINFNFSSIPSFSPNSDQIDLAFFKMKVLRNIGSVEKVVGIRYNSDTKLFISELYIFCILF